jgi:hypothetical protein
VVAAGEHGVDYNFGENVIPTKNEFRARANPRAALHQQLGVTTAVVTATPAADQVNVQITPAAIVVTVNADAPQTFDRGDVDIVVVEAAAGSDSVTVAGTDEAETALLIPGQQSHRVGGDYSGLSYGLLLTGAEQAVITAGASGSDLAVVRDTRGVSDALTAEGNLLLLMAEADPLAGSSRKPAWEGVSVVMRPSIISRRRPVESKRGEFSVPRSGRRTPAAGRGRGRSRGGPARE